MNVRLVLALSFLALALPGCARTGINRPPATAAAGGTAPPSASVSFLEADSDGDARISPQEFARRGSEAAQPQSFQAADTNGDGVLTFDEWQKSVTPPRAAASRRTP